MGLIRIIEKGVNPSGTIKFPAFYMNDFSVLGLVVDQFEKTIQTLEQDNFAVKRENGATWASFSGTEQIRSMLASLKKEKVEFSVSDLVSCAYQG